MNDNYKSHNLGIDKITRLRNLISLLCNDFKGFKDFSLNSNKIKQPFINKVSDLNKSKNFLNFIHLKKIDNDNNEFNKYNKELEIFTTEFVKCFLDAYEIAREKYKKKENTN